MPSQEEITIKLQLLAIHRQNLSRYLQQLAQIGDAFAPPQILNGIQGEREEIEKLKYILRRWKVPVEDSPDDLSFDGYMPQKAKPATNQRPFNANRASAKTDEKSRPSHVQELKALIVDKHSNSFTIDTETMRLEDKSYLVINNVNIKFTSMKSFDVTKVPFSFAKIGIGIYANAVLLDGQMIIGATAADQFSCITGHSDLIEVSIRLRDIRWIRFQ